MKICITYFTNKINNVCRQWKSTLNCLPSRRDFDWNIQVTSKLGSFVWSLFNLLVMELDCQKRVWIWSTDQGTNSINIQQFLHLYFDKVKARYCCRLSFVKQWLVYRWCFCENCSGYDALLGCHFAYKWKIWTWVTTGPSPGEGECPFGSKIWG